MRAIGNLSKNGNQFSACLRKQMIMALLWTMSYSPNLLGDARRPYYKIMAMVVLPTKYPLENIMKILKRHSGRNYQPAPYKMILQILK